MKYSTVSSQALDSLKSIIKSVSVESESPEEILETLDKLGIESYVTEEGHLMIKYWHIGAEDFMPLEQAAIIRTSRPSLEYSNELDWLSKNLQNIRGEYGGKWVAVYDNRIVATASNLPELMSQITELDKPLITFIPTDPVVWTFTYAN